jgi:tryptophan synthase beta chain
MPAYAAYLAGEMTDEDVTDERLAPALDALPRVPA